MGLVATRVNRSAEGGDSLATVAELSQTPTPLQPERALVTPIWLAALVVLVVNDHLLKGSGLLPGVLTGKLSDFAGLIVAPVLLATLIRARSRSALLACHVAVGLVFAGIQLSIPFADLWSAAMGLLGHPWTITSDPTDLIALPMLVVSWRTLVPELGKDSAWSGSGLRQLAVGMASLVGLWATVATSDDGGGDWGGDWGETEGGFEDVVGVRAINNANEFEIAIYVRPLRDLVDLDCDAVREDPAAMLPEHAFGDATHWVLPARTNLPISGSTACGAAWVAGEGIPPQLLFWPSALDETFPGQYFELSELPSTATAVVFDGQGPATWVGGESFRFTPPTSQPELPAACESSSDRIEIDLDLTLHKSVEIVALNYGPDGCFELELLDLFNPPTTVLRYLCVPEPALPFTVGERIRFDVDLAHSTTTPLVTISLLDPDTLDIARDDQGRPVRESMLIRGESALANLEILLGHDLQASPRVTCPWQFEDDCATTERAFDIRLGETAQVLAAGDPMVSFADGPDYQRGLMLVHGRSSAVFDDSCGLAGGLGLDLDVVLTAGVPSP